MTKLSSEGGTGYSKPRYCTTFGAGGRFAFTSSRQHLNLDLIVFTHWWKDNVSLEERTIHAARSGDRAAIGRLLRDLQDCWYRFSLSLLGDGEMAREATQETGLRFLKALPAFRGESQLQTWSLGIALNVAREMRRKAKPLPQLAKEFLQRHRPNPSAAVELADDAEQREAVRAVLSDLPDRQREAIVLRFFEDMSVEQTAATMGCAEGTVKATVHQALRSLKQRLTPGKRLKRADSLSACGG